MKNKLTHNHVRRDDGSRNEPASAARNRKPMPIEKDPKHTQLDSPTMPAKGGNGKPSPRAQAKFSDLKHVLAMIEERWPRT